MRIILLLAIIISTFSNMIAQDDGYLQTKSDLDSLSNKVALLFHDNEISAAFMELSWHWPIPQNEMEAMEEKTMKYLNLVNERFGTAIAILKVNEETIDTIALRQTFLVRFEHTAIRLIFTYYKGTDGWIVNSFKWDDSFDEEFK